MASRFSLYGNIFVENEDANKKIEETTKKGKITVGAKIAL